jgi:hypothetical protein
MDITNDTGQDAKYKVTSGGGTPVGPHGPGLSEDTTCWPVVAAGTAVKVPVTSKGPWQVYFYVNGEACSAESSSDNDQVHLVAADKGFRTMIRKVSHSTGKVIIPANLAKSA